MASDEKSPVATKRLAIILQGIVAAIAVSICVAAAVVNGRSGGPWILVGLFCLTFGRYVAVLVHEVGHVLAGLRAGMIFRQMHVGPFAVSRLEGKAEIFLNGNLSGGVAYMVLPDDDNPAAKIQRFVRGGPTASVVFSILLALGLAAAWVVDSPIVEFPIAEVLFGSLFTVIGTGIPYASRGLMSDAFVLKRLDHPGPERDFLVANFQLAREVSAGVRPRGWSKRQVDCVLQSARDVPDRFRALFTAYLYYADCGDRTRELACFREADAIVTDHAAELGLLAESFWLEKAFLVADRDSNYSLARELVRRAGSNAEILDAERALAQAAIEIGEGKRETVDTLLQTATQALNRTRRRTGCSIEPGLETVQRLRVQAGLSKPQ